MSALPDWVTDPELSPVWDRVRGRFEQAGLRAEGRVGVDLGTREQRRAVGDLLGRTLTRDRVTIDLADLDARLRTRSGIGGLAEVLTGLGGPVPQDRPALRAAREEARERPLALAAELVTAAWSPVWVAGLRRAGLLTGRPDSEELVRAAATVLGVLTDVDVESAGEVTAGLAERAGAAGSARGRGGDGLGEGVGGAGAGGRDHSLRPASRVELGARLLGDAHGLDEDRPVNQLVLRGLAAASGVAVPQSARDRETLWAAFGVEPDLLSRTCLARGLTARGDGSVARRLAFAAESGDPVHLTEWDLRRAGDVAVMPGNRVLVCENPRVLEAVAEAQLPGWSVVCTAGEPNLVVVRLLAGLAEAGEELNYHGDFDWPGVALANRAVHRFSVTPWLMGAADYLAGLAPGAPALEGLPVEPVWDLELGAAMRNHGHALHEESVLPRLLEQLTAR